MRIQPKEELETLYAAPDPWGYESCPDDQTRVRELLGILPKDTFSSVLDVGCGDGFVTTRLPGAEIDAIDISERAISHAKAKGAPNIRFSVGSIFDLRQKLPSRHYELIVITGLLYPKWIGEQGKEVRDLVLHFMAPGSWLVCCHIKEWCSVSFDDVLDLRQKTEYRYRDWHHELMLYANKSLQ
jgi:trans-aconitate methyltransferase